VNAIPVDVVARIERLEFAAREIVEGHLAGRHRSPRHGFAVEFAQHREYSPGDDPKHIDWKVFGRTERHHIKQFEQETNLVAWLLVDASESMRYGSTAMTKYELASRAAAALATLITRQSDAVGLVTFTDKVRHWVKPSTSLGQVKDLLRALVEGPYAEVANVGASVEEIAGRLGRRSVVMIFSDLLDEAEPFLNALRHLKFHKHDIVVFQTLDAAELDFPFRHPTLFKGLEMLPEISTDPLSVREQYLSSLKAHLDMLDAGCRKLAIDRIVLRTDADLGQELAIHLQKRST
jgi:uncharacterized protein (DUF58 family)